MNAGWKTVRLSEIALIGAGNSAPQETDDFSEDGPLFVRTSDVGEVKFGTVLSARDRLSPRGAKGMRVWKSGTILIPKSGASTFVNHRVILGTDAHVSSHLATIAADTEKAAPRFLLYYLSTVRAQDLIQDQSYPSLKLPEIGSIEIPLPPLAEQKRIVALLDEAFAGIDEAKAKAEANLDDAKSLFTSHLQSIFTTNGPGWSHKSVEQFVADGVLAKPFDGNHGEIHPKQSDYTQGGIPFIMARDLQDGHVDTTNCVFISRKMADSLRVGFSQKGDVLISHKGTIGRSAIVDKTDHEYLMLTPQVTGYRILNSSELSNRFLRYYFMSPVFLYEMTAGALDGSTRAYIGITKQLKLHLRFPSISEQIRILERLESLEPEIQRLTSLYERKLPCLHELKESLLTQAFTGELTV